MREGENDEIDNDAIHETLEEWSLSDDDKFYAWLHEIPATKEEIERMETR